MIKLDKLNKKKLIVLFVLILCLFSFVFIRPARGSILDKAEVKEVEVNFFYSTTCSHCADEQKFLDEIEKRYPEVKINRYIYDNSIGRKKLIDLCRKYDAERYIGLVPLTFVGGEIFIGFDGEMGKIIEESIKQQLEDAKKPSESGQNIERVKLPIIGNLAISKYSLPLQAIILGFFDGFNVCSLGALVLILGLVLTLRSKRKILLFGGIFILTTAIIYGLLIVLWYQLFIFLAPFLRTMEILVGFLGIGGGIYFLREFIRFKKHGPTCETGGKGVISRFSSKMQSTLQGSGNILLIIGGVLLFAAIITLVEFPCSAVIPVFFAGILAKLQISTFHYLSYIALFVLFYMLDEIVIFLIAFFTMTIRLASARFVTWIALIQAIVLFLLGFYYLIGF